MDVQITIFLDTRRKKKNGKYPVKLRVWSATTQKQKLYPTGLDLTKDEFKKAWINPKPKGKNYANYIYLNKQLEKADDTVKEMEHFTFEQFEHKLFRKKGDATNVFFHYVEKIERLKLNGQFSTAEIYELSKKSITDYLTNCKGKKSKTLSFYTITPDWLQGFENYMVNDKGRSLTTVSIYIRALRTLFSEAIADKDINSDIDPFGKRKYRVPSQKRVKKALNSNQLKALYNAEPKTSEQRKAIDFWFLSYACNGMNIKDIALLKFKDIQGDRIVFYRAKTKTTSKTNLKPITVYLTDLSQGIIDKYAKPNPKPDKLLFDIIEPNDDPDNARRKVKKFTRYINQHIKKVAADNDLPTEISTYWARHSYATNAVRNGASLETASELLGHSSVKVTEGYFAGFEDETKKQLAQTLTNF